MTNASKVTASSHRSYSAVNQLRTCGEQYRLERVEQVPSRPSCAAVGGTAVHVGTELIDHAIYNSNTNRDAILADAIDATLVALDEKIDKYVEKGWELSSWLKYGKQDTEWYETVGIPNSITSYLDWRLDNPEFVLAEIPGFGPAIEVPFNYYIGGQLIHGWIDRVFIRDGHHCPLDIKSGKKPVTDEQLGLYGAALNKALGWNVEWGYYIYNLKNGEAKLTPPLRVSHWTEEKLGQVYLPATQAIDLGIFIPHPGEHCFHCGVQASCPFVQAVI